MKKFLRMMMCLLLTAVAAAAEGSPIDIKVAVLTFYDMKDVARVPLKYSLEIKHWYDRNFADADYYRIRKTSSYIYIKNGLAFTTISSGKSGTVASLSALLKDDRFNFRNTYFIVTGEAQSPPDAAPTGSVCIADTLIDSSYKSITVKRGKKKFTAVKSGTLFRLNRRLAEAAYQLTAGTKLADHQKAVKYRELYYTDAKSRGPLIYRGAAVTDFSMKRDAAFISRIEKLFTEQKTGRYCLLQGEDNAVAYVLKQSNLLDRLVIIRASTDFDRPPVGRTPVRSSGAFAIGVINNFRAASPLVTDMLKNWELWKHGVPARKALDKNSKEAS